MLAMLFHLLCIHKLCKTVHLKPLRLGLYYIFFLMFVHCSYNGIALERCIFYLYHRNAQRWDQHKNHQHYSKDNISEKQNIIDVIVPEALAAIFFLSGRTFFFMKNVLVIFIHFGNVSLFCKSVLLLKEYGILRTAL